ARAVGTRRSVTVESASDLSRLDPLAIERVIEEAAPLIRCEDELHDYLLTRILVPLNDLNAWTDWMERLRETGRATVITTEENRQFLVAAERLHYAEVLWPELSRNPEINTPILSFSKTPPATTDARRDILRGWMESLGPVTSHELAEQLGWTVSQLDATFEALEGEGLVLRGRFRSSDQESEIEWCHRRLLSRIHRLTMEGLRKQIEPVEVETYMRFLFRHHGLHPAHRREGLEGVFRSICQLQGLDLPAVSWERDLLRHRVKDYSASWLDELCVTGEVGWGRLFPAMKNAPAKGRPTYRLSKNSLIGLFRREDAPWLLPERGTLKPEDLTGSAQDLLTVLQHQGAMFANDLGQILELLPTHLNEALGELVSRGWISSDGMAGLRNLIGSGASRPNTSYRGFGRMQLKPQLAPRAGRWSIWRREGVLDDPARMQQRIEFWAWQLLNRWGVVFRDLLEREQGAPRWFELVQCYRRLEARGEIRGGRFIRGVAGEQYASSDVVAQLRKLRNESTDGDAVVILKGTDPLNLAGIITQESRVPALPSNRIVYWRGVPVGMYRKQEFRLLKSVTTEEGLILAKLLNMTPGEMATARRELARTGTASAEEVANP
ncbi:MAG: DEAD/DEAH box helicase, partial [Planctomycetaceae bacterium]|nr:DEAD/DEAH box helicase [Planctomycetaceae bacterium]